MYQNVRQIYLFRSNQIDLFKTMPVLATSSVDATTSNDIQQEQSSVQIKDIKDGTFYSFKFKFI